jgi:hypothetical protein
VPGDDAVAHALLDGGHTLTRPHQMDDLEDLRQNVPERVKIGGCFGSCGDRSLQLGQVFEQSFLGVICRSCLLDLIDMLSGPLRGPLSRCGGLHEARALFGPVVRLDLAFLVVGTNSNEPRLGR